jgi:uncharacterized membrane protein
MNKPRFEAFSDGVFAFAITLLILNISLPDELKRHAPTEAELTHALLALWPTLLAYLFSFAVLGIMWQSHNAMFRLVERIDRKTIFLNLLLLCVTVFIPFATSLLGNFMTTRPATILYGCTLTASAICFNILLRHLVVSKAFYAHVDSRVVKNTTRAYRFGLITYFLGIIVAFFSPIASFTMYVIVAAYYVFPRGVDADLGIDQK